MGTTDSAGRPGRAWRRTRIADDEGAAPCGARSVRYFEVNAKRVPFNGHNPPETEIVDMVS